MAATAMLDYLMANDGLIKPTARQMDDYIKHCKMYEVRDDHAQAFNTAFLAVNKAYFFPKDASALFEIFNFDVKLITEALKKSTQIHDKTHVIRNDFNMGTIWMMYCVSLVNNVSMTKRNECRMALLKMLNYKFFTGKVNYMLPYGANEEIMEATIDGLSFKCDIKQPATSTWKAVIEAHCKNALGPSSIHRQALARFQPDGKVGYILSDLQTRLSSKIVNVVSAYHENHKKNIRVGETTFTTTNPDGEKVLKELKANLDSAISRIVTDVLNVNSFINFEDVKLICKLVPAVRPDMLRSVLTIFSNLAHTQYKNKQAEDIITDTKRNKIYNGYRVLITELIQKTYRHCIMSGVKPDSHVQMLSKTRDTYRASRMANQDIIDIKNSIDYFVVKNTRYTREATLISIRTAFILYLMVMSFK